MKAIITIFMLGGLAFALTSCGYTADSATQDGGDNESAATEKPETEWLTDYEAAVEASRESERPILVNFTGSDWCPPCIRMKSDVFSKEAFREYANENLVLLELDFPRNEPQEPELEEQNLQLAQNFGIQVFPTYLVVDGEGEEVARTEGYVPGGPEAFIGWIEE